jgi:DNA-binding SARP family transcriptional activator
MDNHGNCSERCQVDIRLSLLGGFSLVADGSRIGLPLSAQRVLVALALVPDQDRTLLGAMLYPDGQRNQVSASLRSALWRAKRAVGHPVVLDGRDQRLRLAKCVDVDLRNWTQRTRQLTSHVRTDLALAGSELVEPLSKELLPLWEEEWLLLERQRWDQRRLHALERLVELLTAGGRHVEALEAGLAAVNIEPYRESAHRALIMAYIAEGNCASAMAQYHRYRRLLTRELGIRPTPQLQALVQALTVE